MHSDVPDDRLGRRRALDRARLRRCRDACAFRAKNVRTKLLAWKGMLLAALAMPLLIVLPPGRPSRCADAGLRQRAADVGAEAPQAVAALPTQTRARRLGCDEHEQPRAGVVPTASASAVAPAASTGIAGFHG